MQADYLYLREKNAPCRWSFSNPSMVVSGLRMYAGSREIEADYLFLREQNAQCRWSLSNPSMVVSGFRMNASSKAMQADYLYLGEQNAQCRWSFSNPSMAFSGFRMYANSIERCTRLIICTQGSRVCFTCGLSQCRNPGKPRFPKKKL